MTIPSTMRRLDAPLISGQTSSVAAPSGSSVSDGVSVPANAIWAAVEFRLSGVTTPDVDVAVYGLPAHGRGTWVQIASLEDLEDEAGDRAILEIQGISAFKAIAASMTINSGTATLDADLMWRTM